LQLVDTSGEVDCFATLETQSLARQCLENSTCDRNPVFGAVTFVLA